MKIRSVAMASAAFISLGVSANAGVYDFTYSGSGETASGTFATNGSGNVVSGTGVFDFPGFAPFAASIVPGSGSDGSFIWDNAFPIDVYGLLFEDAGATKEINLWVTSGTLGVGTSTSSSLYLSTPPGSGAFPDGAVNGTLTISVPEPATWAMLILGFGLAGMALRQRKVALAA